MFFESISVWLPPSCPDGLFAAMAFPNWCSEHRPQVMCTNDHNVNVIPSGVANSVAMEISWITWNKVALSHKENLSVFLAKTPKWNEQAKNDEQR
jgi:hypothetical protein